MNRDDFKRIAQQNRGLPISKPEKTKRLLSLNAVNFSLFQQHCRAQNVAVSELVDQLIEGYLKYANAAENRNSEETEKAKEIPLAKTS